MPGLVGLEQALHPRHCLRRRHALRLVEHDPAVDQLQANSFLIRAKIAGDRRVLQQAVDLLRVV